MAAQAWKIYASAKKKIGAGTIDLGSGIFKMSLHRDAASATITSLSTITIFSSVTNEISARGGYAAGGRTLGPAAGLWTVGASALQYKFTYTTAGLVFTASGSSLIDIRYALIHSSAGSTTSGHVLCYASLSSTKFSISSPNTLTILPAATGIFTLA